MNSEQYRTAVRTELEFHYSSLVGEMTARLSKRPLWSEAVMIEFTFHVADSARGLSPILAYEVSRDFRYAPMGGEPQNHVLSSHTLLNELLDPIQIDEFDESCDIVVAETAYLFAKAWSNSGGLEYDLPGFFVQHDASDVFCLNQRRWTRIPTDDQGCIVVDRLR